MTRAASPHSAVIRRPGFSLRPRPARWFELLTYRDDLTLAVETLARTGRVELDARSEEATPVMLPDLQRQLEEYDRLAQRFQPYWPGDGLAPSDVPGNPTDTLERALRKLRAWRHAAEPRVRELEALQAEQAELELLEEMLEAMPESRLRLALLPGAGPSVQARAFVLPRHAQVSQLPPGVIASRTRGPMHLFVVGIGPAAEMDAMEQELALQKGRRMLLPSWLQDESAASLVQLGGRRVVLEERLGELRREMDELGRRHGLQAALGDIERIEWFLTHVSKLPVTENFAWVTGWTSEPDSGLLEAQLEKAGVRFLLRFPEPPRDKVAPMVLNNPFWAQPFEIFARLIGTPSASEADPSRLLVFIVPLLFGYMFGDVGQGLVLFLVGLWLGRRYRPLRLLVPGGIMSMLFGVLFGSVFGRDDLFPPLWLHPLDEPLLLLGMPLLGGVILLTLGLLLNAVEARWRGEMRRWWLQEAPLFLLYVSLLAALLTPYAGLVALLAAAAFLSGRVILAGGDLRAIGGGIGALLESTLQLLVNTLSFARVGAFALAHAGLSSTVTALADAAGHSVTHVIVMVLGNLIIIALEGLVVAVQITRLVLFEFFIRFLRGEGRSFAPLTAPHQQQQRKRSAS